MFIPSGESMFFKASMSMQELAKRKAGSQASRHGRYLSDLKCLVHKYIIMQGSQLTGRYQLHLGNASRIEKKKSNRECLVMLLACDNDQRGDFVAILGFFMSEVNSDKVSLPFLAAASGHRLIPRDRPVKVCMFTSIPAQTSMRSWFIR